MVVTIVQYVRMWLGATAAPARMDLRGMDFTVTVLRSILKYFSTVIKKLAGTEIVNTDG